MKPYEKFSRIVGRRKYSVATATLLASNAYWDGHNFERSGRNTWLYRTPNGNFFTVTRSQWEGEGDSLSPVSLDEAIELYETILSVHEVGYSEALPGVEVTDA